MLSCNDLRVKYNKIRIYLNGLLEMNWWIIGLAGGLPVKDPLVMIGSHNARRTPQYYSKTILLPTWYPTLALPH